MTRYLRYRLTSYADRMLTKRFLEEKFPGSSVVIEEDHYRVLGEPIPISQISGFRIVNAKGFVPEPKLESWEEKSTRAESLSVPTAMHVVLGGTPVSSHECNLLLRKRGDYYEVHLFAEVNGEKLVISSDLFQTEL